jgi:hypothetical protein
MLMCNNIVNQINNLSENDKPTTKTIAFLYQLKGKSEYRVFQQCQSENELPVDILQKSVFSLEKSIEHDLDPEILFKLGQYRNELCLITEKTNNYNGLIEQWDALLSLSWDLNFNIGNIQNQLLNKIEIMINQAIEMSIVPFKQALTYGRFLSYIIQAGCRLANKKELIQHDSKLVNVFRIYETEIAKSDNYNVRGNKWRQLGIKNQMELFSNISINGPINNNNKISIEKYYETRKYLEKAFEDAREIFREIEILKELAKTTFLFCKFKTIDEKTNRQLYEYAIKKSFNSYVKMIKNYDVINNKTNRLEIKRIYGDIFHDYIFYLWELSDYEYAITKGLTFFSITSPNEYIPKFYWNNYSKFTELMALCASELNASQARKLNINQENLSLFMVAQSWEYKKKELGITDNSNLITIISEENKHYLLSSINNYIKVYDRFDNPGSNRLMVLKHELQNDINQ